MHIEVSTEENWDILLQSICSNSTDNSASFLRQMSLHVHIEDDTACSYTRYKRGLSCFACYIEDVSTRTVPFRINMIGGMHIVF